MSNFKASEAPQVTPERERSSSDTVDPFAQYILYRLRRDALFVVANWNRGVRVENEVIKKQLVFAQSQLCDALLAEPKLAENMKAMLFDFHSRTVSENLEDKRGSRRRLGSHLSMDASG